MFDPESLDELPETARRYLLHAIQPGTPLAAKAELRLTGRLRLGPGKPWMLLRCRQTLRPDGFLWRASAGGAIRINGYDRYDNGAGEMRWRLWSLIPVVHASGDDVSRSARGRLAAELTLLPSALLPGSRAKWKDAGSDTAQVSITVDGETVRLRLRLDSDGRLLRVELNRWGNHGVSGGAYQSIPYAVACSDDRSFGGYTIPTRFTAEWRPSSDQAFPYVEEQILEAQFE